MWQAIKVLDTLNKLSVNIEKSLVLESPFFAFESLKLLFLEDQPDTSR